MPITARPRHAACQLLACCLVLAFCALSAAQQQTSGSIIGHLRVTRGGSPPDRVLVLLQFRGATIDSMYTDSQGVYGFHNLNPNPYYVVIDDDHYQPVRIEADISPIQLSPIVFVDITLVERAPAKDDQKVPDKSSGANQNLTDVREYTSKFPKPAVKEFEKGAKADGDGKKDDAIRHYQKALQIAPDFYEAHNNLGSDYLNKSDFPAARKEFEQAVQENQSDAAGYFNLSNACMLMNSLPEAQKYLDEGIRREPESALGQFLLGSLNMKTGKLPEAEHALRQSIQFNPVMVQPRLQLVNLLLQQGKKPEAIEQLQNFVTTFPDNPFSPQARKVLERLGAPAQAKSH
jgi:thioredoxin-like negative regulator of GroEL